MKELETEKAKRSKAEEAEAKAVIQLELAKAELKRLKTQLEEQQRATARQRLYQGNAGSTSIQRSVKISLFIVCLSILCLFKYDAERSRKGSRSLEILKAQRRNNISAESHREPM